MRWGRRCRRAGRRRQAAAAGGWRRRVRLQLAPLTSCPASAMPSGEQTQPAAACAHHWREPPALERCRPRRWAPPPSPCSLRGHRARRASAAGPLACLAQPPLCSRAPRCSSPRARWTAPALRAAQVGRAGGGRSGQLQTSGAAGAAAARRGLERERWGPAAPPHSLSRRRHTPPAPCRRSPTGAAGRCVPAAAATGRAAAVRRRFAERLAGRQRRELAMDGRALSHDPGAAAAVHAAAV